MARIIAFILLILSFPLWIIIGALIKFTSAGPIIFKQKRVGKDRKIFTMYKFRTMVENAEALKDRYRHLNEADGPVFKIRDDPRYTRVGKLLARLATDEIPQLVNVIKGEMALVGPRPLPLDEADNIPKKYQARFSILPGMTSPWIIEGAHKLSFDEWMRLDVEYVGKKSLWLDAKTLFLTLVLIVKSTLSKFKI